MSGLLLEVVDASCTFRISAGFMRGTRPLRALQNVSLSLEPGRTLAIVGESGCGKSTLAKSILGLNKLSSGMILINGRDANSMGSLERARALQPIFQDPYSSLNPRRTVEQIVRQPLDVHRIGSRAERQDAVRAMLAKVRLPERTAQAYISQLSGGQRQRVAIARALMLEPSIIVCDEPTSALDVSVQAQILNILMELQRERGLAYVFVSHNLGVVEHLADEVAVMYMGRIVERAPTEVLFSDPRHPYTQALLNAVLTPEPGLGLPRMDPGAFPNPIDMPAGCAYHPRCRRAMTQCAAAAPELRPLGSIKVACHLYAADQMPADGKI